MRCRCVGQCQVDHGFRCKSDAQIGNWCRACFERTSNRNRLKPKRVRTSPRLNDSTAGLPLFEKVTK